MAIDVNECEGNNNCSQFAECHDEVCGYSCSCPLGFVMAEDNYTCLCKLILILSLCHCW